jgi:hypothetical protein
MSTRQSKGTARQLGVGGHQKRRHLVASSKADGDTFVESSDEGSTMLALEVDPRVVGIDPQPFTVRLDLSRVFATRSEAVKAEPRARRAPVGVEAPQERIYTPDFLVELTTAQAWVVELKSPTEVQNIAPGLDASGSSSE